MPKKSRSYTQDRGLIDAHTIKKLPMEIYSETDPATNQPFEHDDGFSAVSDC